MKNSLVLMKIKWTLKIHNAMSSHTVFNSLLIKSKILGKHALFPVKLTQRQNYETSHKQKQNSHMKRSKHYFTSLVFSKKESIEITE